MKMLRPLSLIALAASMIGCVDNPRNKSFLENGTTQAIPLSGITNTPNDIVKFQAFNFTSNQWDEIATTASGNQAVTKDNWYAFEATPKSLPLDYWEAVTQKPTYRRRAKVRAVFPNNGGDILGYYNAGQEANDCILANYNNAGSIAARQNCQIGQSYANVYSCKFPPCTPWNF